FITELIPSAKDGFEGPVVLSCDQPVVAAALTQESSGALSTVAMEPSSGSTELYFAQAIRGNSLNTTEVFVQNSDSTETDVTVRFFKSDGTLEETQAIELQPNGGGKIRFGNPQLNSLSVGYAVVSATGNVVATAFYFLQAGGVSLPPIGILPETGSANWRTFAKIEPGAVNTGIAVAIPDAGSGAPNCQLTLYSGVEGAMAGSGPVDFGGNEQLARFITELIPSAKDGFEGPVVLSCDQPVVAAALTQESSGALSTVAMVPSSEDGGGGDPTSGTALLPKRVTGLNLTSNRTLNQTLPAGVQIKGVIGSGIPQFQKSEYQTAPPILSGINAVCNNQSYQGSVDFFGSYTIPVPKQVTCTVVIVSIQSSEIEFVSNSTRAQSHQSSALWVREEVGPPVEVGDADVTQNFSLSTLTMETVQGGVSNLDSLPAGLLQLEPTLVFRSTDGNITGLVTLPGETSVRDFLIELPVNRNYVASLELFEEGEMQGSTGQLTSLYDIGRVNLGGSSLTHLVGTANITANFAVPATASLSGLLSEAGKSTLSEGSFVSAQDTRAPGFFGFFGGLGDGFSVGSPPGSGGFDLTLAVSQQYSLYAGIALDDNRFWGTPAELSSDLISFSGAMTRNFSFPSRPAEVTLSGQVMGPVLTEMAANVAASNVSVSVICRNLSGAPDTMFTGTTNTDGAGNYSINVLSGSACEVEFVPALPVSGFPFSQ
ncbi:MAG TPA: hypothetical protein VMY18_03385, partial [Acidobacteriota bacterium]|nr:hypothetical protein [Acidobacteriota bacterium]